MFFLEFASELICKGRNYTRKKGPVLETHFADYFTERVKKTEELLGQDSNDANAATHLESECF